MPAARTGAIGSRSEALAMLRSTSETPKRPIIAGMKSTPLRNSVTPKVNRG